MAATSNSIAPSSTTTLSRPATVRLNLPANDHRLLLSPFWQAVQTTRLKRKRKPVSQLPVDLQRQTRHRWQRLRRQDIHPLPHQPHHRQRWFLPSHRLQHRRLRQKLHRQANCSVVNVLLPGSNSTAINSSHESSPLVLGWSIWFGSCKLCLKVQKRRNSKNHFAVRD